MESVESEAGDQVRLIEGKKPNIQGEHLLWWLCVDLVVCLKAQTAQSCYKMSHGKSLTNLKLNRVICSWFAAAGRAYVDHCADHWTSTARLTVVKLLHKQIPFTSLPPFSETIVRFWTVEITLSCMDLWLAGGEDNRGEETRFGCKKTDDTPCLVNLVNLSGSPTIVPIVYVAYHLENWTKI